MKMLALIVAATTLVGCDVEADPQLATPPEGPDLVFLEEHGPPDFRVAALDPNTREVETIFTLPEGAFAYDVDVHRDSGAILMSYTEPADPGEDGFDRSAVFRVDADGLGQRVAGRDRADDWALSPRWSADGAFVWYTSASPDLTAGGVAMAVVREEIATNTIDVTIDWATEPAVSPDGEHVAWISVDATTGVRSLELADADGIRLRRLVSGADVYDLGLPAFSQDGQQVYVFIPDDPVVARSADLAARPAPTGHGLHLVPGDWYAVDLVTQQRQRVSQLSAVQYGASAFATNAPGNEDAVLATASATGIEVLSVSDGAHTQLLFNRAIRSLAWRPYQPDQ